MKLAKAKLKAVAKKEPMRIDIGCGKNKKEGFFGVDAMSFEGVDLVLDLTKRKLFKPGDDFYKAWNNPEFVAWPWEDGSVSEVHCSHFIEHLEWPERVHFFNELYRVLQKDGTCQLILPHWNSERYYGDPTHKSPFSEMAFYYLSKEWRKGNAPHVGYTCDFECTWGWGVRQDLQQRNQEYQQFALQNYRGAATDLISTLKKR